MERVCQRCGYERQPADSMVPEWECPECGVAYDKASLPTDESMERRFFITTETTLNDFRIKHRLGVVTAECAFGIHLFGDLFSSAVDTLGGRSQSVQKPLRKARETVLGELENEARRLRAHAVIAVDLDYSEFSGQGKSMLFVVASGTAVRLEPLR